MKPSGDGAIQNPSEAEEVQPRGMTFCVMLAGRSRLNDRHVPRSSLAD